MKTISKLILFTIKSFYFFSCFIFLLGCSNNDSTTTNDDDSIIIEDDNNDDTFSIIELKLRIHIMTDIVMTHSSGTTMNSWVTPANVEQTIIPEINKIWEQAGIVWLIDSVIEEEVVKGSSYEESITFIANTKRDSNGSSDPARLPHLFSLMQPQNMSKEEELGKNLFHIYLFPFIGNTSQGNAMRGYNFHSVVGTWTNKHNGGGIPEKTLLTENQSAFNRGSLSRTISHEIGHVLNLSHNECSYGCLMGGTESDGYFMSDNQKFASRLEAFNRSI